MLRLVLVTGGAKDVARRLVRIKAAPRRGLHLLVSGVGRGKKNGGVGHGLELKCLPQPSFYRGGLDKAQLADHRRGHDQ